MLLKCQINTITKKKDFASYKMFRKDIEILILSCLTGVGINYLKLSISLKQWLWIFCVDLGF